MTKRNSTAIGWATDADAQVKDAETDTTHPSGLGGIGKTAKGWVIETEPHPWENYNIKLREDRQSAVLKNGRMPWDDQVNYKPGALAYLSGILYVALIGSNLNKNPITQTTYWSPVKFTKSSDHIATIADMQSKFTVHTPKGQNSHNDSIGAIGGSTKTTIDAQLKVVSDGLIGHTTNTSNPHNDTATGVGTVPMTGGNFTGRVNYTQNLSIGSNCELMTNISTFVAFRSYAGAIGIGVADYSSGGRWQEVFTEASFPRINQSYNPTFVMPVPDLHFPLMNDLNSLASPGSMIYTRPSGLSYTDRSGNSKIAEVGTPAFEVMGLKLSGDTALVLQLVTIPTVFDPSDQASSILLDFTKSLYGVQSVFDANSNAMSVFPPSLQSATLVLDFQRDVYGMQSLDDVNNIAKPAPLGVKGLFGALDGCISYTLNNVVVVKDIQFTSVNLVYYFGTTGNVKNFRVWANRLTPRQKLKIPR